MLLLIAAVKRLEGCLGNLPDRLRLVLELATGVGAHRALSSAELAHYLRIRVEQIPRLEKQALGRLRLTARTQGCGAAAQTLSGLPVPGIFTAGNDGSGAGGVKAVRYAKRPSRERVKHVSPHGDSLLGVNIAPVSGSAMLIALLVLAALLSIGIVFADALGFGPRHPQWRSRWIHRPPWN